jgi:hypothetical protein
MEKCIIELPVIGNGAHYLFSVRFDIINHINVLRMGIYHPVETVKLIGTAIPSFAIGIQGEKHPVVRAEGVVTYPLHHFK